MAELADAQASGACDSNIVQVQVLLSAPYRVFLQNLKGFVEHSVFYLLLSSVAIDFLNTAVYTDFSVNFLLHISTSFRATKKSSQFWLFLI